MVGSMFVSEEGGGGGSRPSDHRGRGARNSMLLALYEGAHLNRHFLATLAHHLADPVGSSQAEQQQVLLLLLIQYYYAY